MKFTQFMFPSGYRMSVVIDMPPEVETMAEELVLGGWSFEIEKHPNSDKVHMDCCNAERQLANAIVDNGPEVPKAVEELVRRAYGRFKAGE